MVYHCDPSRNAITHYAPCNCTIVAYLHLRKCAGTAIRSLFKMQSQGWSAGGRCMVQPTSHPAPTGYQHAIPNLEPSSHET